MTPVKGYIHPLVANGTDPPVNGSTSGGADDAKLGDGERWFLGVFGLALAVVGLGLWLFPPSHQKPAPDSAKCTDAKTCWVEVEDAPEILLSSLVVLGALLILVGVNGRRLSKVTIPGGGSFETEGAKAAEDAASQVSASDAIPEGKKGVASTMAAEKARMNAIARAVVKQAPLNDSERASITTDAVASVTETFR